MMSRLTSSGCPGSHQPTPTDMSSLERAARELAETVGTLDPAKLNSADRECLVELLRDLLRLARKPPIT
jgi:hypothetical protein